MRIHRSALRNILEGTIWALGEKYLYRIIDADIGGGLYKTGRDSGAQPLDTLVSVQVEAKAGSVYQKIHRGSVRVLRY